MREGLPPSKIGFDESNPALGRERKFAFPTNGRAGAGGELAGQIEQDGTVFFIDFYAISAIS
jgi:hypothetical protein